MIGPTGAVRVMVATKPVDFRKGAEGLAATHRGWCVASRPVRTVQPEPTDPLSHITRRHLLDVFEAPPIICGRDDGAGARSYRGCTKTGQLWAYAADDRPWGGCDPPGVVYVYAPDRKSERPITHLQGFKGILQVDGYAGYRKLADRGDVRLAFCWSHVRRGFYELAVSGPAPIASEALERIAGLYAVEKDVRRSKPRGASNSSFHEKPAPGRCA